MRIRRSISQSHNQSINYQILKTEKQSSNQINMSRSLLVSSQALTTQHYITFSNDDKECGSNGYMQLFICQRTSITSSMYQRNNSHCIQSFRWSTSHAFVCLSVDQSNHCCFLLYCGRARSIIPAWPRCSLMHNLLGVISLIQVPLLSFQQSVVSMLTIKPK